MTIVELRSSIISDLNLLGTDALEHISKYVRRLTMLEQEQHTSATPARKVRITNRIRSLSGRFTVPTDVEYKDIKSDALEEKYCK